MNRCIIHRKKSFRHQRGYLLMSTLILLPVIATITILIMQRDARTARTALNTAEGSQAAQFAVGLRGYMAAVQQNPAMLSASNTGVNWLKPKSCGGLNMNNWPDEGYVPCSYTGGSLGHLYKTTITRDGITNLVEARTSFVVPPCRATQKTAF